MLASNSSWMKTSQLEVLITRACEPSLHEPNYAVHLEIADYINKKKANNPREAAMLIARLANHRNPHVALLALSLLETLVQSCGYPFHLQISTKEFLNELVRRFPERPPPFPSPVMTRILDLIHSWKEGICMESRWREDLGNIRDMHRLLTFKGYRFREIGGPRRDPLAAASNIKSASELEAEDREAQEAKLQELIRRGTPRDLAAAQELMKALAGANPDAKPDYRAQALKDLNKLEQKVILLNEMLDNVDRSRGERFVNGDAYDQVATILKSARPKLQKWINAAGDPENADPEEADPESLDTFLQINDQINTVLARYEAFKKGDYEFAGNPVPQELASGSRGGQEGLSLIDLDDATAGASTGGGSTVAELADLFASSAPAPASAAASTPFTAMQNPIPPSWNTNTNANGNGMYGLPQSSRNSTPVPAIALPASPGPGSQSQSGSGLFGVSSGGMGGESIVTGTGIGDVNMGVGMGMLPPTQRQQSNFTASTTANRQSMLQPTSQQQNNTQQKDPFADLATLF